MAIKDQQRDASGICGCSSAGPQTPRADVRILAGHLPTARPGLAISRLVQRVFAVRDGAWVLSAGLADGPTVATQDGVAARMAITIEGWFAGVDGDAERAVGLRRP